MGYPIFGVPKNGVPSRARTRACAPARPRAREARQSWSRYTYSINGSKVVKYGTNTCAIGRSQNGGLKGGPKRGRDDGVQNLGYPIFGVPKNGVPSRARTRACAPARPRAREARQCWSRYTYSINDSKVIKYGVDICALGRPKKGV